jgi:phage shock protein C
VKYLKTSSKAKFTKSTDRFVAGVAGGIAEYFGWGKAVTRIVMLVAIVISHGFLLIPYFILAWLMPNKPISENQSFTDRFNFMGGQAKKTRKEVKDAEVHDVDE